MPQKDGAEPCMRTRAHRKRAFLEEEKVIFLIFEKRGVASLLMSTETTNKATDALIDQTCLEAESNCDKPDKSRYEIPGGPKCLFVNVCNARCAQEIRKSQTLAKRLLETNEKMIVATPPKTVLDEDEVSSVRTMDDEDQPAPLSGVDPHYRVSTPTSAHSYIRVA